MSKISRRGAAGRGGEAAGGGAGRRLPRYAHCVRRYLSLPGTLRRLALASVVANVGIVITGGAVRLTGSGLGCPTWPRCTDTSYTATAAMGGHGAIEFGNRMLTGVVGVVALLGLASALLQRPRSRRSPAGRSEPGIGRAVAQRPGVPAARSLGGDLVRVACDRRRARRSRRGDVDRGRAGSGHRRRRPVRHTRPRAAGRFAYGGRVR